MMVPKNRMIAQTPALVALLVVLLVPQLTCADDAAPRDDHLAYLVKRQQDYQLRRDEDNALAVLREQPLIRWENPISGANGGVFVWTIDERPVAMTKCHVNDRKQHYVESSVVLSGGLRLQQRGQEIWSPKQSALKEIATNALWNPAMSSVGRLVQMRKLAAEFEIEDQWGEGDGELYQLRLMPRPLYRYVSPSNGVIDGAVFAFVQGTNPEAMILVEAVQEDDAARWRCCISRLTGYAMVAFRNGSAVYKVPKLHGPGTNSGYRHHWEKPVPYPFTIPE